MRGMGLLLGSMCLVLAGLAGVAGQGETGVEPMLYVDGDGTLHINSSSSRDGGVARVLIDGVDVLQELAEQRQLIGSFEKTVNTLAAMTLVVHSGDVGCDLAVPPGVTQIQGNIKLVACTVLTATDLIWSLSRLTSVTGDLIIQNTLGLTNLDAFSQLTSVGKDLFLRSNADLSNINGLRALKLISGNLNIFKINLLTNIDSLSKLTRVEGFIHIESNANIEHLDGLFNCTTKQGLAVSANLALTNIDGLSRITTCLYLRINVCQHPWLYLLNGSWEAKGKGTQRHLNNDNPLLTNLDGLSNLYSTGSVTIQNNGRLLNVDGLARLDSVSYYVVVRNNPLLVNLIGLSNLRHISTNLRIQTNGNLTSLELHNLNYVGTYVEVCENPLLNMSAAASLLAGLEVPCHEDLATCVTCECEKRCSAIRFNALFRNPLAKPYSFLANCSFQFPLSAALLAETSTVIKVFNAQFSISALEQSLTNRNAFETWSNACGLPPLIVLDGSADNNDDGFDAGDDDFDTASSTTPRPTSTSTPIPGLEHPHLCHLKLADTSGRVDLTTETPNKTLIYPSISGYLKAELDPCAKANTSFVCLDHNLNLTHHARLMMRLVRAMSWRHLMLLNDNTCTLYNLPAALQSALLEAAEAHDVSLIAHETAYEASCSNLPIREHPIHLFLASDVYSSAVAFVRSLNYHSNDPRLVYLYPEDINPVSFETLLTAMTPWDTTGELRAVARARTIIVTSKLPELQNQRSAFQMKDAAGNPMLTVQEPGEVVFYSLTGQPSSDLILFPAEPDLLPASEYPLVLRILHVASRIGPPLEYGAAGADAMIVAASEFLAGIFPDIKIEIVRADVTGRNCSVILSIAEQHAVHLVAGPGMSVCVLQAMNVGRSLPSLQFISPIGTSAALFNTSVYPNYLSLTASTLKLGANLFNLVSALGKPDCVTLVHDSFLTPNVDVTDRFRSLLSAEGHDVALDLVFPASADEVLVDELLRTLWANGTGVVVVSLFALPTSEWDVNVRRSLSGRLISMNLDTPEGTSPFAAPFASFQSSTDHRRFMAQIIDHAWIINVAEIVMITAVAAERVKHTHRFGRDLNATRERLRDSVYAILVNNSIPGLYYDHLNIDADGELGATETVIFDENGEVVSIGNPEGDGRVMSWSKSAHVEVVCKQARVGDSTTSTEMRLLTEAILLNQLQDTIHVVKLIGLVVEQPALILVLEYCSLGDLAHVLRSAVEDNRQTSFAVKMRMAQDIARGMASLTRYSIVHSDLSARNVLVDENYRCKVSDLGLAYVGPDMQDVGTITAIRWAAPEVLEGSIGPQSDVWSFGIVLYEIMTDAAALPYGSLSSSAVVVAVKAGYRMPRPVRCPVPVYELMEQCWSEYRARPSFLHLAAQLSSFTPQMMGKHASTPSEPPIQEPVVSSIPGQYSQLKRPGSVPVAHDDAHVQGQGHGHGLGHDQGHDHNHDAMSHVLARKSKRRNLDEAPPTYLTLL
ncbi:uncharacterized protein MONBRDRAFT_29134 [Monosiga brevicollis MX1]|uniref:Protein kinase domain-containing protein n=1 Tax=Monosiga brevicollis TaxID=81824 RepID=A9VA81_MONBE|nr:uncharacterized protein MONBRDRAFT_29134 [Monosiga brevicollis MX1]EDQ85620.1 predicted protein [Monosiga brevicollis MX1]|eukprot:XP_001749569.1 hypothetical protein [Monosiga brevicollis MX1]